LGADYRVIDRRQPAPGAAEDLRPRHELPSSNAGSSAGVGRSPDVRNSNSSPRLSRAVHTGD